LIPENASRVSILRVLRHKTAEVGSDSELSAKISLSPITSLTPAPAQSSSFKCISSSSSSARLLISPGILFDVNDGVTKHVGTLKWASKVYVDSEGALVDVEEAMGIDGTTKWTRFGVNQCHPDEIITMFYKQVWYHDIRASFEPVHEFPQRNREKYARGYGSEPVMKDDRTVRHCAQLGIVNFSNQRHFQFWYVDQKGDLVEIDLRMLKERVLANVVFDITNKPWRMDPEVGPSLDFVVALDPTRNRAVSSFYGERTDCLYRWDLSRADQPLFGATLADRPEYVKGRSYAGGAISAGHVSLYEYQARNCTILNFEL
jgi:hypothetical protein